MSDYDGDDEGLMYALQHTDKKGIRWYWSLHKGWISNANDAWTLSLDEVEAVDNEIDVNKLPAGMDIRDDAEWVPVARRLSLLAPMDDESDFTLRRRRRKA